MATGVMHKYSTKIYYGKNLQTVGQIFLGLDCGKCNRGGKKARGTSRNASEGLVIVAGLGGVSEGLADVAVGPLVGRVAVVGGVRYGVGALSLGGTVLRVVEVKAVADVAEQTWRGLLFTLRYAAVEPTEQKEEHV